MNFITRLFSTQSPNSVWLKSKFSKNLVQIVVTLCYEAIRGIGIRLPNYQQIICAVTDEILHSKSSAESTFPLFTMNLAGLQFRKAKVVI